MPVSLTKIYTKTGDKGTTGLISGKRVSKGCLQMECIGTVDELNTLIGIVRTLAEESTNEAVRADAESIFKPVQNKLFDVGSMLATDPDMPLACKFAVTDEDVEKLEQKLDAYNDELEPLNSFTLPGGCMLNAHAHHARAVCRRAERLLVRLSDEQEVNAGILRYVNRLSDLLFVYTRWVTKKLDAKEYLWEY
jgi:cob(I)alamin adenosyltransferase